MKHALDLFSFSGRVTRRQYLVAGLLLAALKYPLDLLVSMLFGRPWSPVMYLSLRVSPLLSPETPRDYLLALRLVLALVIKINDDFCLTAQEAGEDEPGDAPDAARA